MGTSQERPTAGAAASRCRVFADCDDLTEIWPRFPGLEAGALAGGSLPLGLVVLHAAQAVEMGLRCGPAAAELASELAPQLDALQREWSNANPHLPWAAVAGPLIGGLGLGLAVPRCLPWREPAAFAVSFSQLEDSGRGARHEGGASRPPLLRFAFLPGSGHAGLGVLQSRLHPDSDGLVALAQRPEFAQTLRSYESRDGDLVAYGEAGRALTAAGVLVGSSVGLRPRHRLGAPVLSAEDLVPVTGPWSRLIGLCGTLVAGNRSLLERQLESSPGPAPEGSSSGPPAVAADCLDAAYYVFADLVYGELREQGHLGDGARQGGGLSGLRSAGFRRRLRAPVALLEEPAQVWRWIKSSLPG